MSNITFYTFRFPEEHEHFGCFAEFLPDPGVDDNDFSVTLFASMYPHPIAETEEEAKQALDDLIQENDDINLEIVKVTQQIEVMT